MLYLIQCSMSLNPSSCIVTFICLLIVNASGQSPRCLIYSDSISRPIIIDLGKPSAVYHNHSISIAFDFDGSTQLSNDNLIPMAMHDYYSHHLVYSPVAVIVFCRQRLACLDRPAC